MEVERQAPNAVDEQDEDRLASFGYKQELRRDWGLLHNFGVSFSIIVCHFTIPMLLERKGNITFL